MKIDIKAAAPKNIYFNVELLYTSPVNDTVSPTTIFSLDVFGGFWFNGR